MSQHRGSKKSASEAFAGMEPIDKGLLVAVAAMPIFQLIIGFNLGALLLALLLSLVPLIGLLVRTVQNDSGANRTNGGNDNLRFPLYATFGIAILGVLLFETLYFAGSLAVVVLTIIRRQDQFNSDGGPDNTVVNKPSGLL